MTSTLTPACANDVCEIVADAVAQKKRIRIRGGGSKDPIGAPAPGAVTLQSDAFDGIEDYDPPELVLTAGAGTRLAEIETALRAERQMLAFEPVDAACALGSEHGVSTIGGAIASGLSGSRRLSAGSVRDHLLGFEAVSGHGRHFRAGAKVVKNVTGFDLPKLMAGSWGRLAMLTSVTLKVVPMPEHLETVVIHDLDVETAIRVMADALGSTANVAAAAMLPAARNAGSLTLFRLEGFQMSVAARIDTLRESLGKAGQRLERLSAGDADDKWRAIRNLGALPPDLPVWRIVVAPGSAAGLIRHIGTEHWFADWAGGLLWLAADEDAASIRSAASEAGGSAMLFRGPPSLRETVATLHPPVAAVARLEAQVRDAFDPQGIFNTGRFQ